MTPAQNSGTTADRMPVGRRFEKGVSGNPGGRPAGSKTYGIRQLVAEALNDPNVWKEAVDRYRETLKTRKTVINGLEFAARVNREIGIGSNDEVPGGVTIIFKNTFGFRKDVAEGLNFAVSANAVGAAFGTYLKK